MRVSEHLTAMHQMAAASHVQQAKLMRAAGHEFHKLALHKMHGQPLPEENGEEENADNGNGDNGNDEQENPFDVLGDLFEECAKAHIAKADYHLRAGGGIAQKAAAGLADDAGLEDLPLGLSTVYPADNSSVRPVLRSGQREIPSEETAG